MHQGYERIKGILEDQLTSIWCEYIFEQWMETWFIHESRILFEIANKKPENPDKETFITFSKRVLNLCKYIWIKYIPIEEEFYHNNDAQYDKNKLKNFTPFKRWKELPFSKKIWNLELFFNDIKRIPSIPAKKLNDIIINVKKSDNQEFIEKLKYKLIKINLKSCVSIAKFYRIYWERIDFPDLVDEWTLWIIISIEKYNPYIWWHFYDFVWEAIKTRMRKLVWEQLPFYNIPLHISQDIKLYESTIKLLSYNLWREPTKKEIWQELWFSIKKINKLEEIVFGNTSLDMQLWDEHKTTLADSIEDWNTLRPDQLAERDTLRANLDVILWMFDERVATIVKMRYWIDRPKYTLGAIWEEFEITRERVRQIEIWVIQKLKEHQWLQKMLGVEDDIEKMEDENIKKKRVKKSQKTSTKKKIEDDDDEFDFKGWDDDDNSEDLFPTDAEDDDFDIDTAE